MSVNPALGRTDRIGSLVGGVGLVAYALLGDLDQVWARAGFAVLGVMLTIGGIGGT